MIPMSQDGITLAVVHTSFHSILISSWHPRSQQGSCLQQPRRLWRWLPFWRWAWPLWPHRCDGAVGESKGKE